MQVDISDPAVVAETSVLVTAQSMTISVLFTDSATGAIVADFRGQNALQFPAVLATLTSEQRIRLLQDPISNNQSLAVAIAKLKIGLSVWE